MKYAVSGTDQESGQPIELTVEASDVPAAVAVAVRKGVNVSGVRTVAQGDVPPTIRASRGASPPPPATTRVAVTLKRNTRVWLSLVLIIAGLAAPFFPAIPLWVGAGLAGLVLLYLIASPTRSLIGSFLRVSPDRPTWRAVKLTVFLFVSLALVGFALAGREAIRARNEFAAKQEADRKARVQAQAQAQAEAAATVSRLLEEARMALTAGEIAKAESRLAEASKVADAPNRATARTLSEKIRRSADPEWVLSSLVSSSGDEFTRFREGGAPPSSLDFGFAALTDRAVSVARTQLDTAVSKREEARRQAEAAQEAERRAKEEQLAAERKDAEEKAATERAARAAAQAVVQDKLDRYSKVLEGAEPRLVDSVSVRRISDNMWEATLTVKNVWHLRHHQIRKQDAQTMWEWWAAIASPNDPDSARIKILDGKGNEVGGSRILGGSLIWVQE